MSKYKARDKVVIRSDLEPGCYGESNLYFVEDMKKYRGGVYEISGIHREFTGKDTWYILEGNDFAWCDDMIEGLADEFNDPIVINIPDTAEINSRLKTGVDFLDMFTYE